MKKSWIDGLIYHITAKPKGYKKVKNPPKTARQKLLRPKDARQVQYNKWCERFRVKKKDKNRVKEDSSLISKQRRRISFFSGRKSLPVKKSETLRILGDIKLIKELEKKKVKYRKEELLFITKDKSGQILFLEKGNNGAGFKHIENHKQNFVEKHKIQEEQIKKHLYSVFTYGDLEYSRTTLRKGREGFERLYKYENQYYLLSGIGTNGFVVSAYPLDEENAQKHIRRYKNEEN